MIHEKTNQEKLDDMYKLVQENHEVLQDLLRRERLASFGRMLYWIIVLGTLFGAYYYVKPIVQVFMPQYESFNAAVQKINDVSHNLPEVNNLKNFFDTLKK
jgi:hypothetical protein